MLEELYKNNKPLFIALIIGIIVLGIGVLVFNKVLAPSDPDLIGGVEVSKNPTTIDDSAYIYVHITGAIKRPGVYKMPSSSRVVKIVELAGGFLSLAKTDEINLAETLKDGQKIAVPFIKPDVTDYGRGEGKNIVNINTADEAALDSLPGIGPSAAKKIIEYRNKNGPFKAIEEIKNVSGFKDKKFEKIKEFVRL